MRNELELMETIEKYLKGNLSETEKIAFEKRIATEPELKKEVQLQKELMKGIERIAIKQSAKQGLKKYKFNKNLKNWGLTGLTIAVITASAFVFYTSVAKHAQKENAANELPALNEQGGKLWSDADKYLPLQNFELDAEKDTVVETQDGIVIAIPAHSFLDANGQPATGTIQLEVKEALKAADIMKAGLNTKSGDKLLETGGMFYINARKDDASLKIDPKNALYAEIPTNEVKPNMQLFEGKRLPDGTIDWVNPKPIVKDLIPVDILSLDFYPPHYLDSLKSWGYNTKDKKFTDSLYYSFAAMFGNKSLVPRMRFSEADTIAYGSAGERIFIQNCAVCHSMGSNKITGPGLENVMSRVPGETWLKKFIKNNKSLIASGDSYANKIFKENGHADMTVFDFISDEDLTALLNYIKNPSMTSENRGDGINPAKIKTIWSKEFQNTLLSTREFEERLQFIFTTCNEDYLNIYINNIDKNLSSIDSIAYGLTGKGEFLKFAARGDGKVKNGNKNVELLKAYYAQKSKMFTEAITKTVNEFWNKQNKKTEDGADRRTEQYNAEQDRIQDNFKKELDLNLDEAYRQLGKKRPLPTPSNPYGVHIATTGWYNVDAYVLVSTANRTTLDYTDPQTGKKAIIKYEPFSASIEDYKKYDRVLVYLIPNELNSFMRVNNKNEVFEEKLNELITYKMVCIAYKGEESFYYSEDNVTHKNYPVSLVKTTNAEIQNNVNKLKNLSQVKAMNDELNYMAFEKEETKRQVELAKINELTNKVRPVIFPCMAPIASPAPTADTVATRRLVRQWIN